MATITTDTFLDDGTARTAGEAWTITDCTLTVRTDTRWHVGSPASFTGTFGNLTCAGAIGSIFIDGTKVRWLAFSGGSGNVPAIGTTITQGGVSGYLLGVWASVGATPKTPGTALGATGFLKFREVTGGAFASGALSGVTANATGPDVTGWIEVVADHGAKIATTSKGTFKTEGDWFYLGTTSGVRGTTYAVPTLGGSNGILAGLQIETGVGTNVYEWWGGVNNGYYSSSYVAGDVRGKAVYYTSGSFQIGASGSTAFLPPAGCKIRMPNIILTQCTTAARGSNSIHSTLTTRPTWSTGKYGDIELKNVSSNWGIVLSCFRDVLTKDAVFENTFGVTQAVGRVEIDSICAATCAGYATSNGSIYLNLVNDALIKDCVTRSTQTFNNIGLFISKSSNITVQNCTFAFSTASTNQYVTYGNYVKDSTYTDVKTIGGGMWFGLSTNILVERHDYSCKSNSSVTTSSDSGSCLLVCNQASDFLYQNATVGFNGAVANVYPYADFFITTGNSTNVRFTNIGSPASPIQTGTGANRTQAIWNPATASPDAGIEFSRIFASDIPTKSQETAVGGAFAIPNLKFINVGSYTTPWLVYGLLNAKIKGVRGTTIGSTWTFAAGTHCGDYFSSATTGGLVCSLGLPNDGSISEFITSFTPGNPAAGFDDVAVKLVSTGDSCIYEMPYTILGHTAFQNVNPTFSATTGLANHTYEYDLDTGSGYSGSWKNLTGANLSAETISPTGFKIKFRFVCVTPDNTNAIGRFEIPTVSTSTAQADNLYALNEVTLELTGLIAGSEVRCYTGTDPATAVEIGGTESSGTSFSFSHSAGGSVGFIRIFAMGYQPVNYDPYTFAAADTTLLVQQTVDRNYVNP